MAHPSARWISYLLTHTHLASDVKTAADALVGAYGRLSPRKKRYELKIIDALCRCGDLRGIALATEDPLLLASVARYLPDAPGVDFPRTHFDYNRIEDAMRVQAWYEQHSNELRWDGDTSRFRLSNAGLFHSCRMPT